MKLLNVFDYLFFRVYKFFKERGDNVSDTSASMIVALVQFLTILNLIIIGALAFNYSLPSSKYYFLPVGILIGAINWYRYEKKLELDQLIDRWGSEDRVKANRNGLLIIGYLILSATFPVLYGMVTNGQL